MAAPDEDVYTLCLGTDPQVSKDAVRLRAHDSHDPGVRLALELDDWAGSKLEDYVNSNKIPDPEEIKLFWNAFVDKHMDLEGDDHGHCGNPLDEKKYHVSLNFNTEAHKKRSPGQTRGDRIALNNHTFVFLRNVSLALN